MNQMFHHRPERDRLEHRIEGLGKKIAAANWNASRLRVIERRAGNVGSRYFVPTGKACDQLMQKSASRTANVKYAPLRNVLREQAEFAFEPHRRIIAAQ